jgi:BirA family biotin operon repressor/biotin-[acetyl-CoA-carboxylase] ligase
LPLLPVNHPTGIQFIELSSIDSTNNYAFEQIHANVAHPGTCYFAHEQTHGKGQRSKSWISEKGANIILSIVLKPFFLQPFQQFHLSACIATAAYQFLTNYAPEYLTIKWPNDLYWQNKKLGGILIENIIGGMNHDKKKQRETDQSSNWKWAVVGIGININQTKFPCELKNAVSLKQITGKDFNVIQLAKDLCGTIDLFYKRLMSGKPGSNLKLYNQLLYKKNEPVNFKKGNRNFVAIIKSVNENGQLIIQHSIEEKIDFGQIEWVV